MALLVAIVLIGGNWPGLVTSAIIIIECTDNEHHTTFRWVRSGGGRLFGVVRESAISRGGGQATSFKPPCRYAVKARLAWTSPLCVAVRATDLTGGGPEPATAREGKSALRGRTRPCERTTKGDPPFGRLFSPFPLSNGAVTGLVRGASLAVQILSFPGGVDCFAHFSSCVLAVSGALYVKFRSVR